MKLSRQLAEELGVNQNAIARRARKLGIKRQGHDYFFSSADVLRIMGAPKRGRPKKKAG